MQLTKRGVTASKWRDPPPPVLVACAAIALCGAAILRAGIPASPVLGAALAVVAVFLPPVWAIGAILFCAHLPALLIDPSIGPLSAVDAMMLGLIARVGVTRQRLAPGWLREPAVYGAALFLMSGAVATAVAPSGSAVTAFLRVAAYLGTGVTAYAALSDAERRMVLAVMVGIALGDAVAALSGVSDALASGLPLGRYLGTLGDPAQFGIPVALALLAVVSAPWLVPHRGIRYGAGAVLALALFGSSTRSAWVGTLIALTGVTATILARRRVAAWMRFCAGALLGVLAVVAAGLLTVGADMVGLQGTSTRVRVDSITAAWEFFLSRPLRPTGLGNIPGQFPAYNTWLAMSIALGVPAAIGLAVWVGAAVRRSTRLGLEWLAAALVLLTVSLTENGIFAGSSLTLTWLVLCGLILGYGRQQGPLSRLRSAT